MILNPHDDPLAAGDYAAHIIAVEIDLLRELPDEVRGHFADRCADLADDLNRIAKEAPRAHL